MECNKDTALRVKEAAEKNLLQKELGAAKILALKAHGLYPDLDGLAQLLTTIDVYISAEIRIGGEIDWYRILGAPPLADDATIRKCYRNMALTLHPDKNKSVGAEGAFSLISQAWTFLSDKAQRTTYDQKYRLYNAIISGRKPSVLPSQNGFSASQKPPVPPSQNGFSNTASQKPPAPPSQNGFSNTASRKPPVPPSQNGFPNTDNQKDSDHRSAAHQNPTPRPASKASPTFWTVCTNCRTQFEYLSLYYKRHLVCTNCNKSFMAVEVPRPPVYTKVSSTSGVSQVKQHNFNSTGVLRNSHVSSRTPMSAVNSSLGSGPFSTAGGISSVQTSASTAAGVPGVFRMPSENLKRKREDLTPGVPAVDKTVAGSAFHSFGFGSNPAPKGDMSWKKMCTDALKLESDRRDMETKLASQKGINLANEFGTQKNSFDMGKANVAGNSRRNGIRDISQLQMRSILMEKARKDIRKKLDEWNASRVSKNLNKSKNTQTEVKVKDKEKAMKEKAMNGVKPGSEESVDSETTKKKCIPTDSEKPSQLMSVPDPDFHDFDGDRIENTFGENQVWAVYDDDDGMPRYYALIHSVISKNPFRIKISWLSSKTNDEFAPIRWVSSGFPKTSGYLRMGKQEISSTLNSFSHRVKWTKGSRGLIHIYPKKGDVWALYRNWSPNWNELTKDEIIHQYDMVEVLEDYSEEHGVNVASLVKVPGFKTVFRQNADLRKIRNIPRAEMFRLSHQVPSYLLTGEEGPNAPKGFLELDPASTPMELLQVLTEAQLQELVGEAPAQNTKRPLILHVYKRKRLREKRTQ